jgi:uncharacterized protein YodC (DUF2158 family)
LSKLENGTVVQLRSGGPHMTVGNTYYTCAWFTDDGQFGSADFPEKGLVIRSTPPEKKPDA